MVREFPRSEGWFFLDSQVRPPDAGRSYLEQAFGPSIWADPPPTLDVDGCLAQAGLGWRVRRWQVYASPDGPSDQRSSAPRYRALIRSDTHEVLAVVTAAYSHSEHRTIADAALGLGRAHDPSAWLLGARATGQSASDLALCVVVSRYRQGEAHCIVATNRHGGDGAVGFRVVGVDRATASTTATGNKSLHIREGHYGDLEGRLQKLPSTERGRAWVQDYVDDSGPEEHYMTSRLITRSRCVEVVDSLWPQAETRVMGSEGWLIHPREHLLDGRLAGKDGCWDVYTQICAYLDKESEARERGDATKDRLERLVKGAGEALKYRAAALVLEKSHEDPDDWEASYDPDPPREYLPPGTVVNRLAGWAGSSAGQRLAQERYEQLASLHEQIPRGWSEVGRKVFELQTSEDTRLAGLSDWDLLLLCDGGNGCYGGRVERMPLKTRVVVYTD